MLQLHTLDMGILWNRFKHDIFAEAWSVVPVIQTVMTFQLFQVVKLILA